MSLTTAQVHEAKLLCTSSAYKATRIEPRLYVGKINVKAKTHAKKNS